MERPEFPQYGTSFDLFERFRAGDETAAEAIFTRYFLRLTALARSRLSPRVATRTDPEDVIMSVYRSFFLDARAGHFSLNRGGDLWRLLASITRHKLARESRHHLADCRNVYRDLPLDDGHSAWSLEPTAEEAITMSDELEHLFGRLDPFARRVLELRMQGLQLAEIAVDTSRSERTVRRTLEQIRELMFKQLSDE